MSYLFTNIIRGFAKHESKRFSLRLATRFSPLGVFLICFRSRKARREDNSDARAPLPPNLPENAGPVET